MARRVFVLWSNPLFHDSMRLLLAHPDIVWLGSTSDDEVAKKEISALRPDTVLVEEKGGAIPNNLLKILELCSWDTRIIGLGLESNTLHVYHSEHRTVGRAEDLLRLIQEFDT